MQETSSLYRELLEAQQLGDPNVEFQTRLTIGEPGVLITKQGDSITFGSKAYTKTASGSAIVLTETEDRPMKGLRVFGKTTQNGTPTPDEPIALETVGTDGSVNVTLCGKNLVSGQKVNSQTKNGITFTLNDDGSVTVQGTPTATYVGIEGFTVSVKAPGRYVLSGGANVSGKAYFQLRIKKANGSETYVFPGSNGEGKEFQLDGTESLYATLTCGNYTAPVDCRVYPMIRMASVTDATYEPYKEQTLTVSAPNGLPGIPVTSGGNYTDGNGQQWLCDEVDFEKGVYVQRVGKNVVKPENITGVDNSYVSIGGAFCKVKIDSTALGINTEPCVLSDYAKNIANNDRNTFVEGYRCYIPWKGNEMYFRFPVSIGEVTVEYARTVFNGANVTYLLAEEKTIPLSAEQLAAFAALHTYQSNTTVFNDSGAYTEVKYTMNGDGPSRILTGVSGADSGYDETVLISMETDARVFSEDTPEVGASISSQIDIEMIKPFAELPKQARLVPYVRLSDGLRHSEWIQKGVYYIDTRSKVEDGSSIEKIVLHGYDDMLKAEQDYPESTLSWPAKDLDVVREIAEFIGVAVDDRTVSIMNRGYTIQYPAGYSCRDVLGYIAAMYAGSFIMSDLGDLRLVTIYGIPKETRYLIEPNGYVITFGGDRILV